MDTEKDKCWHLMVQTYDGKISMLQNLDALTARQAYRRLLPDSRPKEYINVPNGGYSRSGWGCTVSGSAIDTITVLGPEGVDLEPWRGVEPLVIDIQAELDIERQMQERAKEWREEMFRKEPGKVQEPTKSPWRPW